MFGTDFRKLIEKTFWSCLKHFGLGPWSVEVAGVTCPRRSAAQIHLGKKEEEEEEETRPLEPWYFKWYLLYSLWSQTMPRDYGLWFQNLRQWLIQVVPCSTVGGNPQRETPFWETKGNSVFILSRLVTIQAGTSAIQQSQSKLFGRFAVFLPSQCWYARFGELTAINNIGRTRRRARSRNSVGWKGPNYFCLRLKLGLLWVHHLKEMSTMAWRTNTAGYHLHTYGY